MKFEDVIKIAIDSKNKLEVTFFSKDDNSNLTRLCAPFDIGPSSTAKDKTDRYHFWDYDSDKKSHTLSLLDHQVVDIKLLNDNFEPSDIIKWNFKPNSWHIKRDWGIYS